MVVKKLSGGDKAKKHDHTFTNLFGLFAFTVVIKSHIVDVGRCSTVEFACREKGSS